MRRKAGALTPLEVAILKYAETNGGGVYGWQYALDHPELPNGTLYRTLGRLDTKGLLRTAGRAAFKPGMPPRRMYMLTDQGRLAQHTASIIPVNERWYGRLSARAMP